MDTVAGQAKDLRRSLGPRDRDRLDQYSTSVRELEQRLSRARDWERNYPLPNLFVSMLQRLGIEAGKFATSTGTMRGLELGSL